MERSSRQMMNEQLKKKFHGKQYVESKYIPRFPDSAERDYLRVINSFTVMVVKAALESHMEELIGILSASEKEGRMDARSSRFKQNAADRARKRRSSIDNTVIRLASLFRAIDDDMKKSFGLFGVKRKLNEIANANRKLTVAEWKKAISKTLGINILEDYYDGNFYAEIIDSWVNENVDLINSIPKDALDDMQKIILDDYLKGTTISGIVKDIQHSYSMTKSHARLIARDQMGKLNCQITKHQQQSCGVKKYKWKTAQDARVRDDHRLLNNKIFDWDHPPIVDHRTGRRCHPGQDYQCRCVAIPVFDFECLDIPVDGSEDWKLRLRKEE